MNFFRLDCILSIYLALEWVDHGAVDLEVSE